MTGRILFLEANVDGLGRGEYLFVSAPYVFVHIDVVRFPGVMNLQNGHSPFILHRRIEFDEFVRARQHLAVRSQHDARAGPFAHFFFVIAAEAANVFSVLVGTHPDARRRLYLETAYEVSLLVRPEITEPWNDDVRAADAVAGFTVYEKQFREISLRADVQML